MTVSWTVVVPVKGTGDAKSRLGGTARSRRALAKAIALDTVDAVLLTPGVGRVLVVTSAAAAPDFAEIGAAVLVDAGVDGLNGAIRRGIAEAAAGAGPSLIEAGTTGIAVLLGDVPALDPRELSSALEAAARYPHAMVADADSTGTVLITAHHGLPFVPAFGLGSRAAHLALGYVEVPIPDTTGLRRDVDTLDQLLALVESAPLAAKRTAHELAASLAR